MWVGSFVTVFQPEPEPIIIALLENLLGLIKSWAFPVPGPAARQLVQTVHPRTGATFNLISSLKFYPRFVFFSALSPNRPANQPMYKVPNPALVLRFTCHRQTNAHSCGRQHVEHAQEVCKTQPRPLAAPGRPIALHLAGAEATIYQQYSSRANTAGHIFQLNALRRAYKF